MDQVLHTACAPLDGPVVDSNGAGDAFSSAFLHAWFQNQPLHTCMRSGAIGGAYACGAPGTAERSLDRTALEKALASW